MKSPTGKVLTGRALHNYRFFLLGIRSPDLVQAAWDEIQAKRPKTSKGRRRGDR